MAKFYNVALIYPPPAVVHNGSDNSKQNLFKLQF